MEWRRSLLSTGRPFWPGTSAGCGRRFSPELREVDGVDDVMQAVAARQRRLDSRPLCWTLNKAGPLALPAGGLADVAIPPPRFDAAAAELTGSYARSPAAGHDTHADGPLAWLMADERQRLTRAALDRLPQQDAEILLLKYTENWSYRELAAHLGIGASAVESRLHRARGRLRRELTNLNLSGD